ncbi:MAG: Fic family protein [Telluria sp.]
MSDKYGADHDTTYCYPESDVLKNLLGITDSEILKAAEVEFTQFRLTQYEYPEFRDFSLTTWKNIHFFLFQDVYEWAGELRTVKLAKSGTLFAVPDCIEREAERLFGKLRAENHLSGLLRSEFVTRVADYYSELNVLHPFREGNGRSQRLLFELIALNAGYVLDWSAVDEPLWIPANIAAFNCQLEPLIAIFDRVVRKMRADGA